MKRAVFAGCLAVMLLLALSMTLLRPVTGSSAELSGSGVPFNAARENRESDPGEDTVEAEALYDSTQLVRVLIDGTPQTMTLQAYLIGVVLGEMPASFEVEALAAQAVAARTFVLRQASASKHPEADVCADSSCCQAYLSPADAAEKLGPEYAPYRQRAQDAVMETDGLVITYAGALIDAVYFSCSGGATEDAVAVWGSDVPYLQSVESPGEEDSIRYRDTLHLPADTFRALFLEAEPEARLDGDPASWFGEITYTSGGGVAEIVIGGVPVKGTALRSRLNLRSTQFTVWTDEDEITFETLGNGHRVGMSQYGAQAMAEDGASYAEIIHHYYTGVEIQPAADLQE